VTEREKIDAAVAELRSRKVGGSTAAPALYRLLWALGLRVPPPLFQGFPGLVLVHGTFFGLLLALPIGLVTGVRNPLEWVAAWVAGGLAFGVLMAAYFRGFARRLGLPRWAEYHPGGDLDEEEHW
jgi:hypothetical protein